jgi:hypothetical protein
MIAQHKHFLHLIDSLSTALAVVSTENRRVRMSAKLILSPAYKQHETVVYVALPTLCQRAKSALLSEPVRSLCQIS